MGRKPLPPSPDARTPTHQSIAADLAAFRKQGGRIERLGDTPLRDFHTVSPFRSRPEQRRPPTPVRNAASRR